MTAKSEPDDCLVVIFGATGDLTRRKLAPALYDLCRREQLPPRLGILGVSRTAMSDDAFRDLIKPSCMSSPDYTEETWERFSRRLFYQDCNVLAPDSFIPLTARIRELLQQRSLGENLLFYLSVAPELYEPIIEGIGNSGLVVEGKRWCSLDRRHVFWQRIVVEKPFGHDLASAAKLNQALGRVFEDESIFRIDHYLGKETVQNMLVFRFANSIWEPLWNRHYIDHVQITAAETVGVEGRAGYYEKSGALRDMVQSHLLQLMAVLTMEPPNSNRAMDLRSEQRKVLEAVDIPSPEEIAEIAVRGQYGPGTVTGKPVVGYRQEPGVNPDSRTETYAALRLHIRNWRWNGVPFLVRSGKRMPRKLTQVVVQFKPAPFSLFSDPMGTSKRLSPNRLIINVQPDEGISLRFEGKVPGQDLQIGSLRMDFDYCDQLGGNAPDAYATLLMDAITGDQALFKGRFEIEAAWSIVMPVLEFWDSEPHLDFPDYPAGSWGPAAADRLPAKHGSWRNPEDPAPHSRR